MQIKGQPTSNFNFDHRRHNLPTILLSIGGIDTQLCLHSINIDSCSSFVGALFAAVALKYHSNYYFMGFNHWLFNYLYSQSIASVLICNNRMTFDHVCLAYRVSITSLSCVRGKSAFRPPRWASVYTRVPFNCILSIL